MKSKWWYPMKYLDQDDIDEMRAEEQAQQAEAQITMFELLRCFFLLKWFSNKPCLICWGGLSTHPIRPNNPHTVLNSTKANHDNPYMKCLSTFNVMNWKVADPSDAAHHRHHDAALTAGFPSSILISRLSFKALLILTQLTSISFQLSGINAVFYYSTNLFITTGLSETSAKYATIGIGSVMVLMTLVSIPLMDRLLMNIILRCDDW